MKEEAVSLREAFERTLEVAGLTGDEELPLVLGIDLGAEIRSASANASAVGSLQLINAITVSITNTLASNLNTLADSLKDNNDEA